MKQKQLRKRSIESIISNSTQWIVVKDLSKRFSCDEDVKSKKLIKSQQRAARFFWTLNCRFAMFNDWMSQRERASMREARFHMNGINKILMVAWSSQESNRGTYLLGRCGLIKRKLSFQFLSGPWTQRILVNGHLRNLCWNARKTIKSILSCLHSHQSLPSAPFNNLSRFNR